MPAGTIVQAGLPTMIFVFVNFETKIKVYRGNVEKNIWLMVYFSFVLTIVIHFFVVLYPLHALL